MDPKDFVKYIVCLACGIFIVFIFAHDVVCVSYPDFCLYGYLFTALIIVVSIFGFYKWITAK